VTSSRVWRNIYSPTHVVSCLLRADSPLIFVTSWFYSIHATSPPTVFTLPRDHLVWGLESRVHFIHMFVRPSGFLLVQICYLCITSMWIRLIILVTSRLGIFWSRLLHALNCGAPPRKLGDRIFLLLQMITLYSKRTFTYLGQT